MNEFQFGREAVNEKGFHCCAKPIGCGMRHEGCAYRNHPWKRANVAPRWEQIAVFFERASAGARGERWVP